MSSFETGKKASHQECFGYPQILDAESHPYEISGRFSPPSTKSRTTCYFFFKDDFEDQRSIVCALCCILRQLFLQKRILLSKKIFEQFEMDGEISRAHLMNFGTPLSAPQKTRTRRNHMSFDAIDECEDRGRSQLMQALCKLYGTRTDFNLKFLVTSRPYSGIRRASSL